MLDRDAVVRQFYKPYVAHAVGPRARPSFALDTSAVPGHAGQCSDKPNQSKPQSAALAVDIYTYHPFSCPLSVLKACSKWTHLSRSLIPAPLTVVIVHLGSNGALKRYLAVRVRGVRQGGHCVAFPVKFEDNQAYKRATYPDKPWNAQFWVCPGFCCLSTWLHTLLFLSSLSRL